MALDRRNRRRPVNVARGNAYAQHDLEQRLFAPKAMCLAQHDQVIANDTGAAVRSDINSALAALFTLSSGATEPSTRIAYMLWADTTTNTLKRRNAANTGWLVVRTLDETFVLARSSNTILDISDIGKTIVATSTFTQTIDAAATIGDGWWVCYRNDGTGTITIDPNAAETIDGASTLRLYPGESAYIVCNGTALKTVGRERFRGSYMAVDDLSITPSVAANALTIALRNKDGNVPTASNPITIPFRQASAGSGDVSDVLITAATTLVISSGSTLGASNGQAFRLWIVGFNDGGTFRLGVINCLSGSSILHLGAWGVASSTAEGGAGAADSAHVFYTGTAVTAKAYRVLGYVTFETGLTTAGTYDVGPGRAQVFGPDVPLPGTPVQTQRTDTSSTSTGTTIMPTDGTIPQIGSDGDQYMTQAITPTSAANVLAIRAQLLGAVSTAAAIAAALFQDAVANSLKATFASVSAANEGTAVNLDHRMRAATTSATTFRVRAGPSAAATFTFNGAGGASLFGGVENSFIEATEVMA